MKNLDIDPTARITTVGQFPEDESLVINFEQVSEDQELYSKEKLRDAYAKGMKDGKEMAQDAELDALQDAELAGVDMGDAE